MQKLTFFLLMILAVAVSASAEKVVPKADIEVVYDYSFINPSGKMRTEQTTLLANSGARNISTDGPNGPTRWSPLPRAVLK